MSNKLNHFEYSEFDSPDVIGSGLVNMNKDFLERLDRARELANTVFNINSGYRTLSHNKVVGGKMNSSHLKGLAVDIEATDSRSRAKILSALVTVGFHRIGIAKSFIHVDADDTKDPMVVWLY